MRPDPYAWSLDPDGILIAASLVAAYAVGVHFYPASRRRVMCFALGAALVLATHVTPLAAIANHYLLSAHLLQNVALAEWAPALVVVGIPAALATRLASLPGARIVTHPAVALPLWLTTYVLWHIPAAYDAALRHQSTLLHVEHGCYFTAGLLFWWPVFHTRPHGLTPGNKTAYLFAAFLVSSPLGIVISLVSTPLYAFYAHGPRLWGLSSLGDQQIAGVTMSVEEALVFFALCAYFFVRFLREEDVRDAFRPEAEASTSGSR